MQRTEKAELRRIFKRRRTMASAARGAARAPADLARNLPELPADAVVGGYIAVGSEIDPIEVLRVLSQRGQALALPVVIARDSALQYRRFALGDALAPDALAIPAPLDRAAEVLPDIVLTPLLAFDRMGGRLGMGLGFFDRTLAVLRQHKPVMAIGVAFAAQEAEALPIEAHDQPLDLILTEAEAIRPARKAG